MASKPTLILLGIFLLATTKVYSNDEKLAIKVNYAKAPVSAVPPVVAPIPAPSVKAPNPPPLVVKVPSPPPPAVKAPTPAPPLKVPPPQPPVNPPVAPAPPAPIVRSVKDCIPLCEYRCQLHSRKRLCMRACTTCCDRCKCVPPGTSGNREKCGKCYTDMLTHGNRVKCP